MTVRYQLEWINDASGEKFSLSGELSDEEVKLLEDFVEYAEGVWKTDFIQTGEKGEFKINFDRESGTTVSTTLPDWNQVMVFLHKFRPLLLSNEKTNFYSVRNLLGKKLDDTYFRNALRVQRDLYSGKVSQGEFQFRSNEVLINSEKVLFDWLNSHEYHRDEEKKNFIESLHQMFPLDASKVIFLRLLIHKAMAAYNLASMIQLLLGKKREIAVTMRGPVKSSSAKVAGEE